VRRLCLCGSFLWYKLLFGCRFVRFKCISLCGCDGGYSEAVLLVEFAFVGVHQLTDAVVGAWLWSAERVVFDVFINSRPQHAKREREN
jgi:hypothetical protein